jgi:hypothetical protein
MKELPVKFPPLSCHTISYSHVICFITFADIKHQLSDFYFRNFPRRLRVEIYRCGCRAIYEKHVDVV